MTVHALRTCTAAIAGALLLANGVVFAQTPPKEGAQAPGATGPGPSDQGLRTAPPQNGVIHPPANTDPGMKTATPAPTAFPTPVIKPPGTPGGNPNVVPK